MTLNLHTQKHPDSYRRITNVQVRVVDGPDVGLCIAFDANAAGTQIIRGGRNNVNRIVLAADKAVSDTHFELQLREKGVLLRDLNSLNGVHVYGLRVHEVWLEPNTAFKVGDSVLEMTSAETKEVELSPRDHFEGLYGRSEVMRALFAKLERFATHKDLRILIHGETGTGKELAARALHTRSPRSKRPFVAINCGTLSPTLANATLFGHVRGAFTDAHDRAGCFEEADGGTLFLDEIAELPLEVQPAFLRVLQEGKVSRIGEFKERPVDVRVICATHKDLDALASQRQFREDLRFRLADFTMELPPLRERGEDVMFLAHRFLREHAAARAPRRLSPPAEELLRSHDWPGNVRELASVIHTACVIAEGEEIQRGDLSIARTLRRAQGPFGEGLLHLPYKDGLTAFQKFYFGRLNQLYNGSLTRIAESAHMTVEGVRQALLRLGLRQ
jgi:DNA-binding NtrC family response regulator